MRRLRLFETRPAGGVPGRPPNEVGSMRSLGRATTGALVVGALGLTACGSHPPRQEAKPAPARPVQVQQARAQVGTGGEEVLGTVRARHSAAISSTVVGQGERAPRDPGTVRARGAVLARISADEIDARVEQSEAQYARAKADFDRVQTLLDREAIRRRNTTPPRPICAWPAVDASRPAPWPATRCCGHRSRASSRRSRPTWETRPCPARRRWCSKTRARCGWR